MTGYLDTAAGYRLAYVRTPGSGPGLLFLPGFASDMQGTKALHLEARAQAEGRAFLRFDYSGHGRSGGAFAEGTIGGWLADALAVLDALTDGPQVLVGSSMGGWIALLLAGARRDRVAGLVTIAAAPDFTEALAAGFSPEERAALARAGQVSRPSAYGAPHVFTRRLIDEARAHLLLDRPLPLPFPVRLLQGTADADVPPAVALRLLERAEGPDIRLTLVKGADHRFSTPDCLALIDAAVAEVIAAARRSG
jgi:pimeloyl-ACP methyl ester carboxylesterase